MLIETPDSARAYIIRRGRAIMPAAPDPESIFATAEIIAAEMDCQFLAGEISIASVCRILMRPEHRYLSTPPLSPGDKRRIAKAEMQPPPRRRPNHPERNQNEC